MPNPRTGLRRSALFLVLPLLLAACGKGAPSPPVAGAPAQKSPAGQTAAQPKQGGKLVMAIGGEPGTLAPQLAATQTEEYMVHLMFSGLVNREGDTIKPGLAESWTQPDPQTYVFKLRRGVKFQDGTSFDANALKSNYDLLFNPKTVAPRRDTFFGMVKSWRVIDDYTFELTLKAPFPPFLAHLSSYAVSYAGSPAALQKWGADFGTHPVGTGPFVFKEWEPGRYIRLVANENYWGGRPYLDEVEIRFVREDSTRATLLRTGEVDLIADPSVVDYQALAADPQLVARAVQLQRGVMLEIANLQKPFDNPNVRQAVCQALDIPSIVQGATQGVAKYTPGIFPSGTWAHDPSVPAWSYNPQRAKELLAAAGLPNGFSTVMWHFTGRFAGDVFIAQAIQGYLQKVGIQAELKTGDQPTVSAAFKGKDPKQPQPAALYLRLWDAGSGDPQSYALLYQSKYWGGGGNYARYKNPQVDDLLARAEVELDQAKRADLYHQAEKIMTNDAPSCKLYDGYRLVAHKKSLQGVRFDDVNEFIYLDRAWLNR